MILYSGVWGTTLLEVAMNCHIGSGGRWILRLDLEDGDLRKFTTICDDSFEYLHTY